MNTADQLSLPTRINDICLDITSGERTTCSDWQVLAYALMRAIEAHREPLDRDWLADCRDTVSHLEQATSTLKTLIEHSRHEHVSMPWGNGTVYTHTHLLRQLKDVPMRVIGHEVRSDGYPRYCGIYPHVRQLSRTTRLLPVWMDQINRMLEMGHIEPVGSPRSSWRAYAITDAGIAYATRVRVPRYGD